MTCSDNVYAELAALRSEASALKKENLRLLSIIRARKMGSACALCGDYHAHNAPCEEPNPLTAPDATGMP